MTTLLAYRPFLDPIDLHRYWFVLIFPMAFFIALAYKAVRVPDLRTMPREVAVMTIQIVLGMVRNTAEMVFTIGSIAIIT